VILAVSTLAADVGLTGPRLVKALGLLPALREADRMAARKILDEAAREARRLGASVTVRYRAPRKRVFAERAVLSEAARERADLIVLGNSGRGAMGDVLLGSVAQRVVSLARRPVVLVRARARRASARKRP
jgi:nucleotide-binding universal stress UspA family protein